MIKLVFKVKSLEAYYTGMIGYHIVPHVMVEAESYDEGSITYRVSRDDAPRVGDSVYVTITQDLP